MVVTAAYLSEGAIESVYNLKFYIEKQCAPNWGYGMGFVHG